MSVSPERPAESLSLGLQAAHGAKRRPLAPRGQRREIGETEKCRRHEKWVSAAWRDSGGAIQELLRLRLHVQTGILMRLVARDGGDAPPENEDAFWRAPLPPPHPRHPPCVLRPWGAPPGPGIGGDLLGAC